MLDALRLAYMMTLKAAISDLPHGGAKSVIIAPKKAPDREALFHAFGDFVDGLDGRYITACDVGTNTDDMDIIATRTPYVIGAAKTNPQDSNPGPHTADTQPSPRNEDGSGDLATNHVPGSRLDHDFLTC